MLERVVLHIGLPKTGTKTLQGAMDLNRDLLRQHGFLYPVLPGVRHAGLALYAATEKASPDLRARAGVAVHDRLVAFVDEFPSRLAAALAGPGVHSVILSSEHCSSALSTVEEIARLHRVLSPLAREIRVIVYLRRQDHVAISFYSARMKSGDTDEFEFVEPVWFDYLALLDRWAEVFGRDNLVTRIFEPAQLHPDGLLADFSLAIGFEPYQELRRPPSLNQSLDVHALEFLRRFNAHLPALMGGASQPEPRTYRERTGRDLLRGPADAERRCCGSLPRQIRRLKRRSCRQIPQSDKRGVVYRAASARSAGAASLARRRQGDRDCREAVAMAADALSRGQKRVEGPGQPNISKPCPGGAFDQVKLQKGRKLDRSGRTNRPAGVGSGPPDSGIGYA